MLEKKIKRNKIVFILSAILSIAVFIRLFTLPATIGLFKWDILYRTVICVLALPFIIASVMAVIGIVVNQRDEKKRYKYWKLVLSLMIASTVLWLALASVLYVMGMESNYDALPLLLFTENIGQYGIPDMVCVVSTGNKTKVEFSYKLHDISRDSSTYTVVDERAKKQHVVFFLKDLKPSSQYSYSIVYTKNKSDGSEANYRNRYSYKYSFNTGNPENGLKLAIVSDAHIGRKVSRLDVAASIINHLTNFEANGKQNNPAYDFLFSLGDLVELGFLEAQWQKAIELINGNAAPNMYNNVAQNTSLEIDKPHTVIPFYSLPGNHDMFFLGHRYWIKYMYPYQNTAVNLSVSNKQDSVNATEIQKDVDTENERYWHHFTLYKPDMKGKAGVHFIALNLLWGTEDFGKTQLIWLEKVLSGIPKDDIVIVGSHCMFYASGYTEKGGIPWYDHKDTIRMFTPLFEKYNVDLVVSGHNHTLELLKTNGVYYAVVGGFGGKPDPSRDYTSKGSVWYAANTFGFLELVLFHEKSSARIQLNFRNEKNDILFSHILQ